MFLPIAYLCYWRALFLSRRCIRLASRTPVISFTFDDFPHSALQKGGAILQEHGLAGTYYTSLGLMNTDGPVGRLFSERDLSDALAGGHELGCHTFDHCHSWHTPPEEFEKSILKNRQSLSRLLPGASFTTLSYPLTMPRPRTKRKASQYFTCCRGGCSPSLNSGTTDLNFLDAFFLEQHRDNPTSVKKIIDQNCARRGWLIFATHDVEENPTRFGCTPSFFRDVVQHSVASGATILPVAAALEKVRETNA